MVVMLNGMYVGRVSANEYTVKELELAGFTVIFE